MNQHIMWEIFYIECTHDTEHSDYHCTFNPTSTRESYNLMLAKVWGSSQNHARLAGMA